MNQVVAARRTRSREGDSREGREGDTVLLSASCSSLRLGERTILLDEDGELAMVRLSPEGLTVLSRATISEERTWTVPTLAGTTLYMHDTKAIRAFDLGVRTIRP